MIITSSTQPPTTQRIIYSTLVSFSGILIFGWALLNLRGNTDPRLLIGLIILNTIAQFAAFTTHRQGIPISVSQAANLAAVALLGLENAVIVAALASIALAFIRLFQKEPVSKGSIEQVAFNSSMETIAIFIAGYVYLAINNSFSNPTLFQLALPWIVASILFNQANLWILSGMLYLQCKVKPLAFMHSNAWAIPVNIAIGIVGSFMLTQAIEALNWQGIILFVFPLMLSAYALYMYIKDSTQQMDVILDRTTRLSVENIQLQQLGEEKTQLLAVLSHDMRTSLSALQASAELLQLKDRTIDQNRRDRLHNVILNSGQHLTSMVNDILNIEQTSHKPMELTVGTFNISERTQNVVASFESLAIEKNITLCCEVDDLPIMVSADQQMLHHIMLNLISNAIKYTPQDGRVAVTVQAQPHCVLLEVQDDGLGIPPQELSQIFNPYYRITSHAAENEGSGLGLAIVKRFIEAHNGSIDVSSKVNEGSRFIVRLPYKKSTATPVFNPIPAFAGM